MANLMRINSRIVLHSAGAYPRSNAEAEAMGLTGTRNKEMRAMTLAAFRITQNNDQLSQHRMAAEVLFFLLADSDSAINHWTKTCRLTREGDWFRLEERGLAECQNTLLGLAGAYSTTEGKVMEWVNRMMYGDHVTTRSKSFDGILWNASK